MNYITKIVSLVTIFSVFAHINTQAMTPAITQIPDSIKELSVYYDRNQHIAEGNVSYATTLTKKLNDATIETTQDLKNTLRKMIFRELSAERKNSLNAREAVSEAVEEFCTTTDNTCAEQGNRLTSPMGKLLQVLRASPDATLSTLTSALSARAGFFNVCGHFMVLQILKFSTQS